MEHLKTEFPKVGPIYLQPTKFFDFNKEEVREFAHNATQNAFSVKEKAIKLFYAVRDGIRYDPYSISLEAMKYKASNVLKAKIGYCLPKANLLIACCRYIGIPAGIGLSDVYNHLCTNRLRQMMGGKQLFLHHGYAVVYIGENWLKAAPAFNIELCQKFNVLATDFDGEGDALFQQYDASGRRHIEYKTNHGIWSDFPLQRVIKDFTEYYPPSVYDEDARAQVDAKIHINKNLFEEETPVF